MTIVHGRHDHLAGQLRGLAAGTRVPDLHVVVAMDDEAVEDVVHASDVATWAVRVVHVPREHGHLPLARSRNVGVGEAIRSGCAHVVLLDVDCVPEPALMGRYCELLSERDAAASGLERPTVLSGEVAYLPPLPDGSDPADPARWATARPHPARPSLAPGGTLPAEDLRLFWSLSFAVTTRDWSTIGGFDEAYLGYGGEDTDYGQRLQEAGGRLVWVGGARAYHQHHDVERPPVRHVEDIVRNANLFASRWGWWPMEGWLREFADRGLARRSPDGAWLAVRPGSCP